MGILREGNRRSIVTGHVSRGEEIGSRGFTVYVPSQGSWALMVCRKNWNVERPESIA